MAVFKSRVKDCMKARGKTYREVTGESGLSLETLSRATKDELIGKCQLETLAKVATVLNVKVKDLFEES